MAVDPKLLLEAVKSQCAEIPERCEGYRDALLETVADVVAAEREHSVKATQIQKSVTAFCERLGDYISDRSTE